ncbi:MAG: glycosyltransferase [Acidimicrobiia bacterium]
MPATVLLLSASMGGGHDGVAKEMARRFDAAGARPVVVDFMRAFPRPLAYAWRESYALQLRWRPESYERSYRLFYQRPQLWARFVRLERALAGRRTLRWIDEHQPDAIVSTYNFAALVLGKLREEGRVDVPLVNFLTDYGVHPRATHPAIDLNLTVHEVAAEDCRRLTTREVVACGPVVRPEFAAAAAHRAAARAELGCGPDDKIVLVSSGSWGVGHDLEDTIAALHHSGRFTVVTATGRDDRLRSKLQRRGLGIALGWTDAMERVIAAADVVVENAGGLTAFEAFAAGVPIVSYKTIPGHGRDNLATMLRAAVTTSPQTELELIEAVTALCTDGPTRAQQIAAASRSFVEDPTSRVLGLVRPN